MKSFHTTASATISISTMRAMRTSRKIQVMHFVMPDGKVTVVAGSVNSTILLADTSAQFGRSKKDQDVLYFVANGGMAGRVPGTNVEGGKVLALDVPSLLENPQKWKKFLAARSPEELKGVSLRSRTARLYNESLSDCCIS
jgi:hypothetical protein